MGRRETGSGLSEELFAEPLQEGSWKLPPAEFQPVDSVQGHVRPIHGDDAGLSAAGAGAAVNAGSRPV